MGQRSQIPFAEVGSEFLARCGWSESEASRKIGLDRSFFRKAMRGRDYSAWRQSTSLRFRPSPACLAPISGGS